MTVSVIDLKEATEYLRTFATYISEASQLAVLYCISIYSSVWFIGCKHYEVHTTICCDCYILIRTQLNVAPVITSFVHSKSCIHNLLIAVMVVWTGWVADIYPEIQST